MSYDFFYEPFKTLLRKWSNDLLYNLYFTVYDALVLFVIPAISVNVVFVNDNSMLQVRQ